MDFEKLDKRSILSWRLGRLITFIVTATIFLIGILFLKNYEIPQTIESSIIIGFGLILTYMLFGMIIYPEIEYRQWRYCITEDKVEIRHGIFFITTTIIPIIRIQHISASQGPINRRLGLHNITISLASGSFTIEGLTQEKADKISQYLKDKLYSRLNSKGDLL